MLFCLAAAASAQSLPQDSPLDNPFPEQQPGYYQPPDAQPFPLVPPGIPPAVPNPEAYTSGSPAMPGPSMQPSPPPVNVGALLFGDNRKTPEDYRSGAFQKASFGNTYLPRWARTVSAFTKRR